MVLGPKKAGRSSYAFPHLKIVVSSIKVNVVAVYIHGLNEVEETHEANEMHMIDIIAEDRTFSPSSVLRV